jgi:hypothetical protein
MHRLMPIRLSIKACFRPIYSVLLPETTLLSPYSPFGQTTPVLRDPSARVDGCGENPGPVSPCPALLPRFVTTFKNNSRPRYFRTVQYSTVRLPVLNSRPGIRIRASWNLRTCESTVPHRTIIRSYNNTRIQAIQGSEALVDNLHLRPNTLRMYSAGSSAKTSEASVL